jgi:phospholipid transport system transporter-binding protein
VIAELLGATTPAQDAVFRTSEDGGRWRASGALTSANAGPALAAARALPLPSTGLVQCDGITAVDSAAVALLLALKRHGAERGSPLTFVEVPAALKTLAALYGVEDILGT